MASAAPSGVAGAAALFGSMQVPASVPAPKVEQAKADRKRPQRSAIGAVAAN
jgi:hypothetical protein